MINIRASCEVRLTSEPKLNPAVVSVCQ